MSTILVVEDHPTNRKLVRDILVRAGYKVLEAASADDGLALARSQSPDLIVMDMQLPGMDGLTATRVLKSDMRTKTIPVLALTAHAMSGDAQHFLRGGCDAYLPKPLRYANFLEVVQGLLPGGPPTL